MRRLAVGKGVAWTMTPKIETFLREAPIETPCLVVDLDVVAENYKRLHRAMPLAEIYYAVKANPAKPVLETLAGLGSSFDAASVNEVEACLAAGALAESISFGNTVKKQRDIELAYQKGVRLFAFDCENELMKIAEAAPDADVYCRIAVSNEGAEWPLSGKFGCPAAVARNLMIKARDLGLGPRGISFHVGSQQTDTAKWDIAIAQVAMLFTDLREQGIELKMINLGGGYPVRYRRDVPEMEEYGETIMDSMRRHFGNAIPDMFIEPGRSIIGNAGVLETEVVLVSTRSPTDEKRWVYLDVGLFGGLAETMDEAIRYHITTPRDSGETGPVAIAGPTCDGMDVMYQKADYSLPLALRSGDKVRIHTAGAYTSTYASVGFNGFEPLQEHYI